MSAMQRRKGAAYECRIAAQLTDATGTPWRRRVRNKAGDSDLVADEPTLERFSIECKHATQLNLSAWWRQAQAQAGTTGIPILIYRKTGARGDTVVLDAHHVNPSHWPVAGRHTVSMDWETAMQWLREKMPPKLSAPGII